MKTLDEFLNKQYRTKTPAKGSAVLQKQRKKLYGRELPEGWDVVSFGQIFRLVDKKSRKVKIKDDQMYKLVTVKLYAKGVVLREIKQGSEIKTKTMYKIQEGDFIISKIDARNGAYGFVPQELDGAVVSGDFPIWRLKELDYVDKDFVDLYLSQPMIWELIRNFVTGSTNRKRVSPEEFMYLVRIPLPPLEEQRKIVYVLKTVQRAIEQQEKIIRTTKELKRALMKRLFTKGLDPNQPTKMTEIGEIPEHWELKKIEDIGTTTSGGTPDRSRPEYWNGDIPWIKSGELSDDYVINSEEKITELGLQNSSAKLFPPGTLLIAMYGATAGKTGILKIKAATNQAICAILPKKDMFVPEYLMQYLIFSRDRLINDRYGGAQLNLSQTVIKNFLVALPPTLEEQRKIANILLTVDRKIELAQQKCKALEELFSTLRHKLMAGQIRVSNLKIPTK